MRSVWIVSAMLLLQSCGAKYHLNRAIAKDPDILNSVVVKVDTTIITENKAIRDTLILERHDTITIERNAVRVQIKRINDTIVVDAECLPDTIRIQKVVEVPQVVYKEDKGNRWLFPLVAFVIGIIMAIKIVK